MGFFDQCIFLMGDFELICVSFLAYCVVGILYVSICLSSATSFRLFVPIFTRIGLSRGFGCRSLWKFGHR